MVTNDSTPSERAQILLKMLVERYITDGKPVGSRALAKFSGTRPEPGASANIMQTSKNWDSSPALAHFRGPHTDAARLPLLRRHAAQSQAARPGGDQPVSKTSFANPITLKSWCRRPRTCFQISPASPAW